MMLGYKITYDLFGDEKTFTIPRKGDDSVWASLRKYDRNLFKKIADLDDKNDVIIESVMIGERCDDLFGDDPTDVIVDGELFKVYFAGYAPENQDKWKNIKDCHGRRFRIKDYWVEDKDGNMLGCVLSSWMTFPEMEEEIRYASYLPRQTPTGGETVTKERPVKSKSVKRSAKSTVKKTPAKKKTVRKPKGVKR